MVVIMTGRNELPSSIAHWQFSYYDLVLAALPLALLVGFLAGALSSIPPRSALAAASAVAALLVGDAVFRNPPSSGRSA